METVLEILQRNENFHRLPHPFSKYGVITNFGGAEVSVINVSTARGVLPFKEEGSDRQYVNIYTDIRHPVTGRWKREKIQLAEAVLRATQGPPKSSNLQCSHLDGDATNCAPDNLAWETRTTNIQRQLHANNFNRGANNPNAKLSHAQREEVIRMGRERYTATAIAHTFRVSVSTVSRILKQAGITTRGWRTI